MKKFLKDIRKFINENDQIHYCIRLFSLMNVINRDNVANSPSMAIVKNNKCTGITLQAIWLVFVAAMLLVNGVAMAQVKVIGNVYGGGNAADVGGNATINMSAGQIGDGTADDDHGNVFGGGQGKTTTVVGKVEVNIGKKVNDDSSVTYSANNKVTVKGSVYGGSALGAVNGTKANDWDKDHLDRISVTDGQATEVNICAGTINGNIYGGGRGYDDTSDDSKDISAKSFGAVTVTVGVATAEAATTAPAVEGSVYGGSNVNGVLESSARVDVISGTIGKTGENNSVTGGYVHGGGYGQPTLVKGDVTINIGQYKADATQKYSGFATIKGEIYGGSAKGNVNAKPNDSGILEATNANVKTEVNIYGGTVDGDIYGGGYGLDGVAANVYGNVTVNVGATDGATNPTYYGNATIGGSIFGCNNANGSPQGDVVVNIYKTAHTTTEVNNQYPSGVTELDDFSALSSGDDQFAIKAVYGGGNEAAYTPPSTGTATPHSTTVHVYGCDENTVKSVYGGGNAADVGTTGNSGVSANTNVVIDGGRFLYVFGGGNGEGAGNPGANIYGTAKTEIKGGLLNQVFGGSNSKGDVDVVDFSIKSGCTTLLVNESFGGANFSDITGDVTTTLTCDANTKVGNFYGGSNQADIDGSVTLNVYGGEFTNVFGGSKGNANKSADITGDVTLNLYGGTMTNAYGGSDVNGAINGKITVNVLNNGGTCELQVTNIYGGGNLTPYEPSYDLPTGITERISPVVNFIHGSALNVFGGAKGSTATVTSSPQVNIGYDATTMADLLTELTQDATNYTSTTARDDFEAEITGNVYGGGDEAPVIGNTTVYLRKTNSSVERSLFGGGNMANVSGNTAVNIINGTVTDVYGGGALANVGTDADNTTQVTITNGTVGTVYGGGLGRIAADAVYYTQDEADAYNQAHSLNSGDSGFVTTSTVKTPAASAVAALVNGAVTVTVNGGTVTNVFGCNNQNGSPQSTVTVAINSNVSENVYGGGNLASYSGNPLVNINNGTIGSNVYGGGKGSTAIVTGNPVVTIGDITEGHESYVAIVTGDVYGGGDAAAVTGSTSVTYNDNNTSSTVSRLFGGGNAAGVSSTSNVTLTSGTVTGGVYGGCNANGSVGPVTIALNGGTVGSSGTNADVYGGGLGSETSTTGNIGVTLNGTTIYGDLYGGSAFGSVNSATASPANTTTLTISSNTLHGTIYGGGKGDIEGETGHSNVTATSNGNVQIDYNIANDNLTGLYGGANVNGHVAGDIDVNIIANVGASGAGNSIDIFGGGLGASTTTDGDVTVTIDKPTGDGATAPAIYGDIYGGSSLGEVGASGKTAKVDFKNGTLNGTIFGGGKGDDSNAASVTGDTEVAVGGGSITGGVYGGCNANGNVAGDVTLTLTAGQVGASGTTADVFGGGYGHSTSTSGNIGITLNGTIIYGDLYGGSAMGSVNGTTEHTTTLIISSNTLHGTIYGGGQGDVAVEGDNSHSNVTATSNGNVTINYNTENTSLTGLYGGANINGNVAGNISVNVRANIGAPASGTEGEPGYVAENRIDIFGGGLGAATSTNGNVTVTIEKPTGEGVAAPVIYGAIYGGSALGSVNDAVADKTTVNVLSGTIHGNIYGGGLGEAGTANVAKGQVNGTVFVNIGSGTVDESTGFVSSSSITGDATIDGDVYGCNNTNGSPKGDVTVNIYQTAHTDANNVSGTGYAIANVFGGGRQADYSPVLDADNGTTSTKRATVHVHGCNNTIEDVFGGGDAAAAYGVATIVDGGRFNRVFGGGNGEVTEANIGAGGTNLTVHGGKINTLFGGSNTSGTITGAMGITVDNEGPCSGEMDIDEFFCGNNLANIGADGRPVNITATIGCGTKFGDVYGGCNQADIFGNVTLTIVGGEMNNVYGGSKGRLENEDPNNTSAKAANINGNVTLNIYGGKINNDAFGGSNKYGNITGSITVNMDWSQASTSCNSETDLHVSNVYGASNLATYTPTTPGNYPEVNIKHGTVSGSVFGGGKGSSATVTSNPKVTIGDAVSGHSAVVTGNVYGGGDLALVSGSTTVTTKAGGSVSNDLYGGGNNADVTGSVTVNIEGSSDSGIENVYGGGALAHTNTANWNTAGIADGTGSWKDGQTTTTNGKTTTVEKTIVNLTGGTIKGNVYGGGLGEIGATSADDKPAYVYGDVTVTLNGTTLTPTYTGTGDDRKPVTGQIFGCNNLKGTPFGHVIVNVKKTVGSGKDDTTRKTYDVAAVYGGGNQADYIPVFANSTTDAVKAQAFAEVVIEGCDDTSIDAVYGGGNAAAVPATKVTVIGSYIINRLYGGGNGKDKISLDGGTTWINNPGANVGIIDPTAYAANHDNGKYGTGKAETKLYGGYIDNVYGGSNTKGDIIGGTDVATRQKDETAPAGCCEKLVIGQLYGAGSQANMDGDVNIILECMPEDYVAAVYGGAENAIINGNVTLTVTSGKFGRVFGGNNAGGSINGKISVIAKEEGCKPLEIGELYGGGNEAPYSIYGCSPNETTGKWSANTTGAKDYTEGAAYAIDVLVESCTSIGKVFGGGNEAEVIGNTHVEINMFRGRTDDTPINEFRPLGKIGQVFGGGNLAEVTGDTFVDIGTDGETKEEGVVPEGQKKGVNITRGTYTSSTVGTYISPTANQYKKFEEAGVYGGGNQAAVNGNTTVNIGTAAQSLGVNIDGNVYGGGKEGEITGNTQVNVCAKQDDNTKEWLGVTPSTAGVTITGDVFGAGQGVDTDVTKAIVAGNSVVKMGGGSVKKSVYGGGELSQVGGNTDVTVMGGTIGTPAQGTTVYGGATYGNIYGGGKGQDPLETETGITTNVRFGLIKGNTVVTVKNEFADATYAAAHDGVSEGDVISSPEIIHNIYGGGAYGSVGTYTYESTAADAKITGLTSGGKATITVTGGTIGKTGQNNGMVFGSSRGDVGAPNSIHDKLAWVYDTEVKIGTQNDKTDGPTIKGSVYGGGENGHNYNDANVYIYSGTIGIHDGTAADATRGNVYGGGCGTDKYYTGAIPDGHTANDGEGQLYNPLAGIVYGDATITMEGGTVKHNVYGAGAMGSVGKFEKDATTKAITFASGGTTTIAISGGTVGHDGNDNGNVFGAARGDKAVTDRDLALVKETSVTISGTTTQIKGNVYGGGEVGNVHTNTKVDVLGGAIARNVFGGGKGVEDLYTCEQAMVGVNDEGACQDPSSNANKDKGTCVTISNGTVGTLNEGNLVEGTGNVYGGGEIGRVEWNTQVKIGVGTGEGTFEPVIYGNVFGAGKGLETHGYSALVRGNSTVTVQGNAKIGSNVYGGGENSTVGRYWVKNIPTTVCEGETAPEAPDVPDGMPYKQRSGGICRVTVQGDAEIGYNGAADNKGHVFGAGKGVEPSFTAGTTNRMVKNDDGGSLVPFADDSTTGKTAEELYLEFLQTLSLATNSFVTIDGNAKVKGSVFGGSESGFVQHDTNVTIQGNCEIGTTSYGNVFGGGKGLDKFAEAGKVKGTTTVAIINGNVKGNVYGGGSMGDVGTITKNFENYNYTWKQTDGTTANTHYNNDITDTNNNTGICTVAVSGGIIGIDDPTDKKQHGNVFGASRGHEDTWWCEKAMVFATDVSVTAGTVKGNVYGGGEVGRVEDDSKVTIGDPAKTDDLIITGSVFGAGAGKETHGYSALVRGNADVIVQGVAKVGGSVFGGGEIASVGRFKVIGGLPTKPQSGGTCTVLIQGKAEITGNVFGACEGVESKYVQSNYKQFRSMQTYTSGTKDKDGNDLAVDTYWNYYPDDHTYVWRYYPTEPEYLSFLKTLALTSNTHVTIAESANVKGSVYGGGELGVTLGGVDVNMTGGTVLHDVYGGGSLADSNTAMWDADNEKLHDYVELDLLAGLSHVTGYFEGENKTLIETPNATAESGKTYYAKYKTNVNLTGGIITHDAYGGGLGRKEYGTKGKTGYVSPIEAMVYGDVKVELNKIQNEDGTMKTSATGCVVDRVFGCNNLNGTPKGKVQVYVYATQSGDSDKSTISDKAAQGSGNYDVAAVYGGGNLAAYKPIDAYSDDDDIKKAARPEVYIDGCDLTSIKQVYGGGNAAPAPATYVEIDRAYEIDEAFGGGNGYDNYSLQEGNTKVWYQNPGANVGYYTYADYPKGTGQGSGSETDPYKAVEITKFSGGSENKANRLSTTDEDAIKLRYGSGVATLIIKGGTVHTAYGGSNSKGNVRTLLASSISSMFDDCPMDIGQSYGGGKNAYSDADAEIIADCAKGVKEMFGGSKDADFDGNVNMRITNGSSLKRVFGGNNTSGAVNGFINITIEEGGCEPIRIEELYAGGFLAPYSVYGYEKNTDGSYKTQKDVPYLDVDENGVTVTKYHDQRIPNESGTRLYPDPRINVVSATYIGNIFGGGYQAKLVGNPHVNVNMTTGFVNVTKTEKAEGDPADQYDFTEDDKRYVYKDVAGNTYDKNKVSAPDAEKPTELIATTDVGTIGNIYGGGNMADIIGDTYVEIGTGKWVKLVKDDAGKYNEIEENLTRNAAHITGNVFGGGKGKADNFLCDKAMVGVVDSGSGSTNVTISNGTVDGTVYGGGEIGRVESNTKVTIGTEGDGNSKPEIKGNVYGAGKGLHTHGYSALVRGNTEVFVQGSAKVDSCVYGGGELASVGRYTLVNEENQSQYPGLEIGMPGSFANNGSGKCVVKVRDNAVIGLDNMQMTATGGPDDAGHVFGAGKGAVPKVYSYNINDKETMPRRMMSYTSDLYKADKENITWEYSDAEKKNVWEYFDTEAKYITFIETMALATETEVTVSGKSFVKGSVYGGSENGFVQHGTEVTIEGGQIGAGENMSTPYDNDQFVNPVSTSVTTANALKPCAHWDYEDNGATYDRFAGTSGYDSKGGATTAKDGHTFYGNVFGGGSGYYPYAPGKWHHKAGSVGGNTVVTITGGHILSNVYGGNEQTDVGTYSHGANDEPILADGGKCTINMSGGTIGVPRDDESIAKLPTVGHLYGAGKGDKRILFNTWTNVGSTDVNVSGGIIYGNVYGGGEDGHVTNLAKMTVSEADPTNKPTIIGTSGTSGFDGDVFGGGQGSVTALTAGVVGGDVNLKVEGGNIKGSVYGGGRLASVGTYFAMAKIPDPNDKTKEIDNPNYGRMQDGDDHGIIIVSLTGGTVNKNVFGGCMGSTTNDALGVSKNVTVNLNGFETKTGETTTTTIVDDNKKGCVVKGSVFGCNNLNSSPLGSVLVHVFGTQKDGASQIANTSGDKTAKTPATKKADGDYDLSTFDVKAVYGGGNLAAYKPQGPGANLETYDYENTTHYAEVIIDGCERTSIGQVYGGGNAASTPATKVTVNGSYEIGEVFGGGNGKDKITINNVEKDNPGANVGFYDYSAVEATYDTKDKRQQDAFKSKYVYGTGKAAVNIFGGTIHRVFGGSNTKGNVRQSAITMLEEVGGCEFCVDEAYGGGKSAPMDAEAKLLMSCIPGLKEVYGGAQAADVYDNVSVTITNGTFNRVFGGNNLSGTIRGSITVNVEETGCRPVIIGELYGGGNLAGYSVYGYDVDNNGNVTLKQSGDSHWNHPQVNAKAFTSIGSIFGGGYGTNAVMVGDPTVNINVAEGDKKDYTYDNDKSTYKNANDEDVPYYDENGFKELTLSVDGHDVTLPSHTKGKIGAINNVFGGGNAAKVIGNTNVNVGTEAEVYMVKEVKAGDSVSGLYTRTGEGTTTSPYVYSATESTAVAVDGTTYYVKKTVLGADIRGNVYGGGNAADVTGKTNVVIGKKIDE